MLNVYYLMQNQDLTIKYKMTFLHLLTTASVILTLAFSSHAQKTTDAVDSIAINEAILIKEQQQAILDSLVKHQLKKELSAAVGNAQRTRELEEELRRIAINDSLRLIANQRQLAELKKN